MCWDALYFIVSTFALVVQKQSSIFISKCMSPSTNATSCPWNHTIERILDHLIFQFAAWCSNRFTKLSQIVLELFESHMHILVPINWRYSLVSWDFFQQSLDPEQLTSSKQPTNWNNNRKKMVKVIQLVLIGPFQLIPGGSKMFA
jgi:hypothetical protein